ncbi:hypothetical protein QZH41_019743 [Actinostola sp. cb2023]|nr:hypothetical protein QZH41_019743 [Actinostola sp. cb2023]
MGNSPSSSVLDKLCGSSLPKALISDSRFMYVTFKSNFATSGKGFLAVFEATDQAFNRFIAVGIAIGATALVLIIILVYWKIKKRRNKGEEEHDDNQSDIGTLDRVTPDDALLGNSTDSPHAQPNDYDVAFQPRPVPMETYNCQEDLKNCSRTENDEEFAWFKPSKRKSKGFE